MEGSDMCGAPPEVLGLQILLSGQGSRAVPVRGEGGWLW